MCGPSLLAAVQNLTPEVNIQVRFGNSSQNMPFNVVYLPDLGCIYLHLILTVFPVEPGTLENLEI